MNNIKAAMISAIVVCMLILGVLYYSDVRDQRAYRAWAQEQNQILNESRRAAEAEAAKAREIAKAEKAAEVATPGDAKGRKPRPEGDWIRIRYRGREGYVSAKYVSVEDE